MNNGNNGQSLPSSFGTSYPKIDPFGLTGVRKLRPVAPVKTRRERLEEMLKKPDEVYLEEYEKRLPTEKALLVYQQGQHGPYETVIEVNPSIENMVFKRIAKINSEKIIRMPNVFNSYTLLYNPEGKTKVLLDAETVLLDEAAHKAAKTVAEMYDLGGIGEAGCFMLRMDKKEMPVRIYTVGKMAIVCGLLNGVVTVVSRSALIGTEIKEEKFSIDSVRFFKTKQGWLRK